ncbi:MAG TPA: hypothetical protein VN371_03880 [Chlorobaculum sp.]|nr:hypothetical protein [Chlorobaculum sp.]
MIEPLLTLPVNPLLVGVPWTATMFILFPDNQNIKRNDDSMEHLAASSQPLPGVAHVYMKKLMELHERSMPGFLELLVTTILYHKADAIRSTRHYPVKMVPIATPAIGTMELVTIHEPWRYRVVFHFE